MADTLPPPKPGRLRQLLVGFAAVVVVAAGAVVVRGLDWYPVDFLEFWAAGQLMLSGDNPYDQVRVLAVERELVGDGLDEAIVFWYPPWTLPLVVPFMLMPAATAVKLLILSQLALVVLAANRAWRAFAGLAADPKTILLITATFAPTLVLLRSGQITGWCLCGLAGHAAALRSGRPILAGVCAALTATKPHLLAVFGLSLLIDAVVSSSGRRVVMAGGALLLTATAIVELANPGTVGNYITAAGQPASAEVRTLQQWPTPTVGYVLRVNVAPDRFAVQFVPLAIAAVGLVALRLRIGANWNPVAAVPWLTLVSLIAAPYGVWSYDLILLLVPIVGTAGRLVRSDPVPRSTVRVVVGLYAVLNLGFVAYWLSGLGEVGMAFYALPVVTIGMVMAWRVTRGDGT